MGRRISRITQFAKDWTLVIAILTGIIGYFVYVSIPWLDQTHVFVNSAVTIIQPLLIFAMLFLTFTRISIRGLKLRPWHWWLLLIQGGSFIGIGFILILLPHSSLRVVLEGAMILLICPTATAGAVVTRKLGGDINDITTYTILINLLAALLVPVLVPLVHHTPDLNIINASFLILGKVFPLLLLPLITAVIVKRFFPAIGRKLASLQELSFYLWAVALSLAIAVTTRSIVHSTVTFSTQLWLVVISIACCLFQFAIGRKIGSCYGDKVTAGQSMGQKNTVFAIWLGYTFFSPVTSIAGGFYSIWHNLINTRQLYLHKKNDHKK